MADWDVVAADPAPAQTPAGPGPAPGPAAPSTDWNVVAAAPAPGPQPLKQLPNPQDEASYQQWVNQNLYKDNGPNQVSSAQFHVPGMDDQTVTVDPYGNGVGTDLRRLWRDNSKAVPVPFARAPDPNTITPDVLDRYATPETGRMTPSSIYSQGHDPAQLGSWDQPNQDEIDQATAAGQKPPSRVWRDPGYVAPTLTDKVLSSTKKIIGAAEDAAAKTPAYLLQDAKDTGATLTDPGKMVDNVEDTTGEVLKGLGGSFNKLGTTAALAGSVVPIAADKIESIFTGKDGTGAQDWYFNHAVDPLVDHQQAFEVAKDAGMPAKLANGVGNVIGVLDQAILTGPQVAAETVIGRMGVGVASMSVPAVNEAVDTGRQVYEKTGDRATALKAATASYITTAASGAIPAAIPGKLLTRAASGAVIGAGQSELSRRAMNAAMPDDMQTPYSGEQTAEGALFGAGFGAAHGVSHGTGREASGDADFQVPGGGTGAPPGTPALGGPDRYSDPRNVYDDYMAAHQAAKTDPNAAIDQVMKFHKAADEAAQQGNQTQSDSLRDMANRLAKATGVSAEEAPPAGSAAAKREDKETKTALIAHAATDSGEVDVVHGDDGHTVTVNDEPVAKFQTAGAAESAAEDAKQQVDDRRIDTAQRKKVTEMTDSEKTDALLRHDLTNLPNRRAYEESDKKPVQTFMDVDGLKTVNDLGDHAAGDRLLKVVGDTARDISPNFGHFGGDEFYHQADTQAEAEKNVAELNQRLAATKFSFKDKNGGTHTLNGITISSGHGATMAQAEQGMHAQKADREAQGLRAPRGQLPKTATYEPNPASAPAKKAARQYGPDGPNAERDTVLQYLARHPEGLSSVEAAKQGIDPASFNDRNHFVGIKRPFRKTGMDFDHAAEMLHEAGYHQVADENGHPNPNSLTDVIQDELARRKKPYSIHNTKYMDDMAARRQEDEAEEAARHKQLERESAANTHISPDVPPLAEAHPDVQRLTHLADKAMEIDPKGAREAIFNHDDRATIEAKLQEIVDRGHQAEPAANADQGIEAARHGASGEGTGRPPLEQEAHTEEDLRARAEAEQKSEADRTAADTAARQRAQADRDRDAFSLTGSERASDANPNQADMLGLGASRTQEAPDQRLTIEPPRLSNEGGKVDNQRFKLRPRPTKLFRGTESGKAGLKRFSHNGEMGSGIYATPHRWLAQSYGGGPKAKEGAGREVHEINIPHMVPEAYGYIHGGSKTGERAQLQDVNGKVLHDYDGTKNIEGHGRDKIREIAQANGIKMLVGMPGSIAENQASILDPDLIKGDESQSPVVAQGVADSDLSPREAQFLETVSRRLQDDSNPIKTLREARNLYEEVTGTEPKGSQLKRVDELVERAVVHVARNIVAEGDEPTATYDRLVKLYERQPSLNTRTSTSIADQAYSTPAPLAYLASDLGGINQRTKVLEPTAGNGMLLIAANPKNAIVNELNPNRAASLKAQGFDVTENDASADVLAKDVDVLIANPPFGTVREADGGNKSFALQTPKGDAVKTNEVDHAIVLKQLTALKPDGNAVLLIGGPSKLAKTAEQRSDAYNGAAKRKFFYHLYGNYNVVDHFTVSGDLYSRQGAAWPIDVIVIHGQGKSALDLPAAAPPRMYDSYDALKDVLQKDYGVVDANRVEPNPDAEKNISLGSAVPGESEDGPTNVSVVPGGPDTKHGAVVAGPAGSGEGAPARTVSDRPGAGTGVLPNGRSGAAPGDGQPVDRGQGGQLGRVQEPRIEPASSGDGQPRGPQSDAARPDLAARQSPQLGDADGGGSVGQRTYAPKSKAKAIGTLVPGNMGDAVQDALKSLEKKVGPIDAYVAKQLGYDRDQIPGYFSAEQVDALGLALSQIGNNSGFIIGDQTGIGKGRVVAGILRYAIKNGHVPIFVTEKPNLYGDMVRDLRDIGQEDIRPLMTNADETIPLDGGGELKSPAAKRHTAHLTALSAQSSLGDHNILFTTYNQLQTVKGKPTERNNLVNSLMRNAIVVLDESHNAGGNDAGRKNKQQTEADGGAKTGRAAFVRGLVNGAKGVFYSSATYAKRPSVMDLYSKTDMRLAVEGNVDKLPGAISAGGVPLQQAVASMLAKSGQYIRRERSFAGVDYNTPSVPVSKAAAEGISKMMLGVKEFDDAKQGAVLAAKKEAKREAKLVSESGSTGGAGAESSNFTSVMHNLIGQMLLSLKADAAADRAIAALKAGEKPVITVANTMGSFIKQYVDGAGLKGGDRIGITFKDLMKRYLEKSRDLTVKNQDGSTKTHRMSDEELGGAGRAAFNRARDIIENAPDIDNVPISPIDWIHKRLRDAGYTSNEITGRQHTIEYQTDGEPIYRPRPPKETSTAAKTKTIQGFNNGTLDAVVLNQAGATGLSLHASEKFRDQRRRRMIIAQSEQNIDTHMQMLGRVHRTGQVIPPAYDQMVADIPAEKRPAAVLAKKMASLNANTTASRDSNFTSKDTPDFINDYGDEVVAQLMADMPEVHKKLGEPLESGTDGYDPVDAARKVTGRIPMLPVAEQEELYSMIEQNYADRLAQANAMGENALEAKTLDLDAKTDSSTVLQAGKPGSDSPFAGAAHAEQVDVKRIGKPYTSEQVREMASEKVGLKQPGTLAQIADLGKRQATQLWQGVRNEYMTYHTGEEQKMLANETPEAGRQGRLQALDGTAQNWQRISNNVHIGGQYAITVGDQTLYGVVTDVIRKKAVKMPVALGSWSVKFALADGARQMTIPFSKIALESSSADTGKVLVQPATRHPMTRTPVEQMFDDGQTTSREKRTMMTGNILAAMSHTRGGQIVHFTDDKGEVRQGVLMPRTFKMDEFVKAAPVRMPLESMDRFFGSTKNAVLKSTDGMVEIQRPHEDYMLSVPKSKADGGQYFLDKGLQAIVGDFTSSGNRMRVMLDRSTFKQAAKYLEQEMGQHFETRTHRDEAIKAGGQGIGTEASGPNDTADVQFASPQGWDQVEGGAGGMQRADVERVVADVLKAFPRSLRVNVRQTAAEFLNDPKMGQNLVRAGATDSNFKAFHHADGSLNFVADHMNSPEDVKMTVAHELIGHYGPKALWGNRSMPKYQAYLDGIAKAFPAELRRRGNEEFGRRDRGGGGFDFNNKAQRDTAAEEIGAYYAGEHMRGQSIPERAMRWVQSLLSQIRDWGRKFLGLPQKYDKLWLQGQLNAFEKYLKGGGHAAHDLSQPAFGRTEAPFYSAVGKAVDAVKREKGTGAEWESALKNMAGVKPDELDWLGIKDWAGDRKVTKAELAEYVDAHQVHLGEVLKGGTGGDHDTDDLVSTIQEHRFDVDEDVHGDPQLVWPHGRENEPIPPAVQEAFDKLKHTEPEGTDYDDYRTPGGENYREMLMTLGAVKDGGQQKELDHHMGQMMSNEASIVVEARSMLDYMNTHKMRDNNEDGQTLSYYKEKALSLDPKASKEGLEGLQSMIDDYVPDRDKVFAQQHLADLTRYVEAHREAKAAHMAVSDKMSANAAEYTGGHWKQPNVLAHIRFDDREGPDGEKILHIHEVQSDWHQTGRKRGYQDGSARPDPKLERAAAKKTQVAYKKAIQFMKDEHPLKAHLRNGVSEEQARSLLEITQPIMKEFSEPAQRAIREYEAAKDELAKQQGLQDEYRQRVPDAPFKTSWHELAMKRMIRYAAEHHYDKITWDTGDTNAERYNMSNTVDKIHIAHNYSPDGTATGDHDITATKDGRMVVQRSAVTARLPDLVGKDISDKVVADMAQRKDSSTFEGDDLKVGGRGMVGFYDKMLPNSVNKLVKKWGAKVSHGTMGSDVEDLHSKLWTQLEGDSRMEGNQDNNRGRGGWYLMTREGSKKGLVDIMERKPDGSGEFQPVPRARMTPKLRDLLDETNKVAYHRSSPDTLDSLTSELQEWQGRHGYPEQSADEQLANFKEANRNWREITGTKEHEGDMGQPYTKSDLRYLEGFSNRWDEIVSETPGALDGARMPVHSLDITDAMRDSVMQGQPMFERPMFARKKGGPSLPSFGEKDEDTLFGKPGAAGKAYGVARRAVQLAVHNPITSDLEKLFNPAGMDPFAEHTAQIATVYLGKLAQDRYQAQEHLQQFSRAINKMSPSDHLEMIDNIENGRPQSDPKLQPIADAMRKMLDTWRDHVRGLGTGHLENFIENYFPHYWKDESKAKSLFAAIQGRRPLKGPATFLKKRTIPTTKEGIEYGLQPVTTNPLILALLKVNEMQKYISGVSMMRGLKDAQLAQFVSATAPRPDGWTKIEDAIAKVSKFSEAEGGFVHYGDYYMPTHAARIINNHVGRSKVADVAAVNAFKRFSNLMNAFQLSFSGFHLGFTTLDAMISKQGVAVERLLHGEPVRAVAAMLEGATPVGAAMNIARGMKLLKAYTNPAGATPEMKMLVAALSMAGGRVHMDRYYQPDEGGSPFRGVGIKSLASDVKAALTQPQGKVSALTKALGSFPVEKAQEIWNALHVMVRENPILALPLEAAGRVVRSSSSIIMEHIVPMQKLGVFSDLASDYLRRNPDATPMEATKAMQSIWRSVDNRLGEMVYDNLFWDRTFKDGMHLAFRAVGWNWGDYREIGGAPVDLVKLIDKGMKTGKITADDVGHKIPYVIAMVAVVSTIGATLGYLYGRKPESIKDLAFPRTGTFDKDGTEQRISLPSYMKDVFEYSQHPLDTTVHKLAPIWNTAAEMISNTDYFGNPIWNPDGDSVEKMREGFTFLAQQYRPFSFTNQRQFGDVPGAKGDLLKYGTMFGITPAPGSITKPEKIEEREQYEKRKAWIKKLTYDLKKAQAGPQTPDNRETVRDLKDKLKAATRAAGEERSQYNREKSQARGAAKQRAAQGNTSSLLDTVGPLIDQGGTRAEQAQRIHAAGYPALAGLIGSLPETLRPQMANALREA